MMNNFFSQVMPNDLNTTLYIRKGIKSRLYALVAHTKSMVKNNGRLNPSQSALYLGHYDTFDEAKRAFDKYLPKKVIEFRREA